MVCMSPQMHYTSDSIDIQNECNCHQHTHSFIAKLTLDFRSSAVPSSILGSVRRRGLFNIVHRNTQVVYVHIDISCKPSLNTRLCAHRYVSTQLAVMQMSEIDIALEGQLVAILH